MDQRLVAHLKTFATGVADDKGETHDIYYKIQNIGEQIVLYAKQAQGSYVTLEDMERLCQLAEILQKEMYHLRSDVMRRKNLELPQLVLPSPNTQQHLPCSNLLSPSSSAPQSPGTAINMSTGMGNLSSSSAANGGGFASPLSTPSGSPTSPHGLGSIGMDGTSTALTVSDEFWKKKYDVATKFGRRSPSSAPLYVNLTEQMIIQQSSKKRPAEGDLFCHSCKTKDTPEWRRGPHGPKTLCNACGIRWRLSQAEASGQKKGDSPPSFSQHQLQLPQPIPTPPPPPLFMLQPPTAQSPMRPLAHPAMQQFHHSQQQQQQQPLHMQFSPHPLSSSPSSSHHAQPPPHMVLAGHVGLAQENMRMSENGVPLAARGNSSSTTTTNGPVMPSLMPSPIAT